MGAPGFGKTRLALRAAELAESKGYGWTFLRATKSSAEIPLGVLSPLVVALNIGTPSADELLPAALAAAETAGARSWVVVVDDAHLLDEASLAVLDQLVVNRAVRIVYTAREGEAPTEAVVSLWKDQHIVRIEVGPLPRRDLRALAAMAIGGPVEGASLQTIIDSSGGNVLFLRELLQGAVDSEALTCERGLWRLRAPPAASPRLRELIEARLLGLSDPEREALELVALGDPLRLDLAERLAPLEVLESLESKRLVDACSTERGPELRLGHPLYGEALRAHLPAVRKVRLSRLLADAAEAGGGVERTEALRVALWRLDGGGRGRLDTTLAAANQAVKVEDYALALRLGRAAFEQWGSPEAALVVGDALDYLGRSAEAVEVLAQATAGGLLDDRQRTNLAVRRASALFRTLNRAEEADRVLAEAASAITDRACLRELAAVRGDHLLLGGDVAAAIAVDQELLAEEGDAAFAQASLDVGTGLAFAGRTTEAFEHTANALAVRRNLDDHEQLSAVGVYLVSQSLALFHHGELRRAAEIAEAGYQVAVERQNVDGQAWFASMLGLVRFAQGRVATAAHLFREVAALFGQLGHPGHRWGLGGLALAAAHQGDLRTAEAALGELAKTPPTAVRLQDVAIMRGRAWTALAAGQGTKGRRLLWEAVEQAEAWGQRATAAEALHDIVRTGVAQPAAERLEDLAGSVEGPLMVARVTFARALDQGDVRLAGEAADAFDELGARLFAAEAAQLEGSLAAQAALRRRSSAARARAQHLLERCEGARLPWLASLGGGAHLSQREREVALLAARRLTSKEIAEQLFVSTRTVENHLQRVYTKLGIKGRGELAERLALDQDPGPTGGNE